MNRNVVEVFESNAASVRLRNGEIHYGEMRHRSGLNLCWHLDTGTQRLSWTRDLHWHSPTQKGIQINSAFDIMEFGGEKL